MARPTGCDTRAGTCSSGAQLPWGATTQPAFHDLECRHLQPFGVRLDPLSGERRRLDGTSTRCRPTASGPEPRLCAWASRNVAMAWSCRVSAPGPIRSRRDGIYLTSTEPARPACSSRSTDRRRAVPALSPARFGKGTSSAPLMETTGHAMMFLLRWLPRSWMPWKRRRATA